MGSVVATSCGVMTLSCPHFNVNLEAGIHKTMKIEEKKYNLTLKKTRQIFYMHISSDCGFILTFIYVK